MASMTHTTGPWFYDRESGAVQMDDRSGEDIQALVATVNFENTDHPQADADGRLIAATPDMLMELREMRTRYRKALIDLGWSESRADLCLVDADRIIAQVEG